MEGNIIPGGTSYGVLDLQNSMQIHPHHHHHNQNPNPNPNPNFPHSFMTQIPDPSADHNSAAVIPFMDYTSKGGDHGKSPATDDDDVVAMGPTDEKSGKKGSNPNSPWHRMKWTDSMVRLLITAVSYTGEDTGPDCTGGRRKFTILQKKGKWKAISKVMGERGCYVSPQQCEDKFNDLNKRYKRLTDILGRGTSCDVVENPALLDHMDQLSDKLKDDVRKILSSKHLFYEEMCSYHNGNRVNLPEDPALQKALQLALRTREDQDNQSKRGFSGDADEGTRSENSEDELDDDDEEDEENHNHNHNHNIANYGNYGNNSYKRVREDPCCGGRFDMNKAFPEASGSGMGGGVGRGPGLLEMERKRLQLQAQMLELERQRFKWERFSKKKERELQRMRMQNERMRLENERMELELKHKELDLDLHSRRNQ